MHFGGGWGLGGGRVGIGRGGVGLKASGVFLIPHSFTYSFFFPYKSDQI